MRSRCLHLAVILAGAALGADKPRDPMRLLDQVGSPLEVYLVPEASGASFSDANGYLVCDKASGEALALDAGARSGPLLAARAKALGLKLTILVSTHFHGDHTGGNSQILSDPKVRMVAPAKEAALMEGSSLSPVEKKQLVTFSSPRIDVKAKQGDELKLGDHVIKVLEIPGHSPGGICLHFPAQKLLFSGDALLKGSIGRTGLPRGTKTPDTMVQALRSKLLPLPDDTAVLPGHGEPTTIGAERSGNPWLQAPAAKPAAKK